MTKHIHRLATGLQEQLIGAAMAHGTEDWPMHAPRVQLDAWATLWRWHTGGERITRITQEQEEAIIAAGLPDALPLASAPTTGEAIAVQLPKRSNWIVIARHVDNLVIPVSGNYCWAYSQPQITYCASVESDHLCACASGYINLIDQPTAGAMRLLAGSVTDTESEQQSKLTDAKRREDEYRLNLAIGVLYRRVWESNNSTK